MPNVIDAFVANDYYRANQVWLNQDQFKVYLPLVLHNS